MILRLPHCYPIGFHSNWWHWNGKRGGGCTHGPKSEYWPWWKFVAFSWRDLVKANAYLYRDRPAQHSAWRLWIYTRFGAWHGDFTIDRRGLL